MKLPEFSVKRKVTASMMAAILVVLGAISFTRLGLDFFPDLEFPTVSVITTYSGSSSEDIENVLTRPLEQIVSSVNRVKKITSQTSEGVSAISIEFEWGTNLDFAAQDVRDQIGLYEQFLPPEAGNPLVLKFNFSLFPVIFYGITADIPALELKKVIEDEVAPRLERLDGVASAQVFSMDEREILVDVDRAALESHGMTLDQVYMALRAENINLPAGSLVVRHSDILVRTLGEFRSLDDIRRTVIGATTKGDPIYLGDVAEVKDTLRETRYVSRIQQQNGVYLIVNKRSGANTQQASTAVKRELAALEGTIPGDPVFHVAMDQGDMIEQVTSNTGRNAWVGGLLAIILIFLFLRNWRPTFIIGLAVPLSVITTFIALYAAGYTLNLLTIGGLALGVGMLVDNAIVVIENVYRHLEEGEGPDEASISGAREVGMAITASTLTTIAVFFPMIFAQGITGKMTQALGLSVAFALLASLFVALTVVPLSTSLMFRSPKSLRSISKGPDERQFAKARAVYGKWLSWALRHRRWVIGGALLALVAALAVVPFLGTEFLPAQDQNMILLKVRMPVGTALDETDRVVTMVERIMAAMPEITVISAQVGSQVEQDAGDAASGMANTGTHEAMLWVGLVKREQRTLSDQEILELIRRRLPNLSGVKFEAVDMSQSLMGGAAAPVEIKLFGRDLDALSDQADRIVRMISGVEGLRDLTHSMASGKPEIQIRIDRERAYRLGLSVSQVAGTVQTATLGRVATRYREGSDEIDIRLRFQERYRDSLEEVRRIPIMTPAAKMVFLEDLADIGSADGPIMINRENQARRVSVTANIVDRDLGSVVRDIKGRLSGFEKTLPPGYFLEYGGAYEQMTEAFLILAGAFALAILLVYMIMASQFEHFTHPFVIMFTVPLGIIGVIIGLLVTGRTLNLAALIGVIMLAGIAVNNGIVMIDYINQLIKRGVDRREAVLQGATTRLRAVLLTALTTILASLPMAFSRSSGSEFRAPLGVAIAFGLMATTLLTLFVIPVIYSLFNKIRFKDTNATG
jgi:hydrophobic/amphiphilic exporter-1 (mainly G- bacteria), HAE1 family